MDAGECVWQLCLPFFLPPTLDPWAPVCSACHLFKRFLRDSRSVKDVRVVQNSVQYAALCTCGTWAHLCNLGSPVEPGAYLLNLGSPVEPVETWEKGNLNITASSYCSDFEKSPHKLIARTHARTRQQVLVFIILLDSKAQVITACSTKTPPTTFLLAWLVVLHSWTIGRI